MSNLIDVVIIGAGPYGLSLAAHLRKKGVDFRIFGRPMGTWQNHMPAGMCLKSEGFASNLSDPDSKFTLKEFCRLNNLEYADIGVPVKLEIFSAYGVAFQKLFVPDLSESFVSEVRREGKQFRITLQRGEQLLARKVVVAAGLHSFGAVPEALSDIPQAFMSHSSRHHDYKAFKGQSVTVIGSGSSAIDVALSLHDAGALPQVIARGNDIQFHGKSPDKRSLIQRVKSPWSGLGPSWRSRMACDLPLVYHLMPREFRIRIAKKHLGPAPGWFTRDRMHQHVPMKAGLTLAKAEVINEKVRLEFLDREGEAHQIVTDHVVAATGYRVDLRKLNFLPESVRAEIRTEDESPILSSNFESSVRGLYFIGTSAAFSFGPLLRFAFGARFAARRLSSHLARNATKGMKWMARTESESRRPGVAA
jgi:thioredoxin reductase